MKKVNQFIRHVIFYFIDLFYGPFKRIMPLHTFRYAACGGSNTVFDNVLFTVCYNFILKKHDLHIGPYTLSSYIAALMLSFPVSFSTGFYLNRYIVFKESGLRRRTQLYRFIAINAICFLLNYIVIKVLVKYMGFYPSPAKITATVVVVGVSYYIQTHVFFKAKKEGALPVD